MFYTTSPNTVTLFLPRLHLRTHTHKHACACHLVTPPTPPDTGAGEKKTLFSFRKQINSSVGDQLWELAESL